MAARRWRWSAELKPDVITCDLIMPELDGVGFIREQMARRPIPIVVVSIASESGELVLAALDAGAVDFVQKPTALATDRLLEISDELIEKVKAAARARPVVVGDVAVDAGRAAPRAATHAFDIVVIGISTGGPQALKMLIPKLPAEFSVPIAIVLHMPVGYTELYARKLNEQSALTVLEAQGGEVVTPGHVYIAPAGRHLTLRRNGAEAGRDLPRRAAPRYAVQTVSRFAVSFGRRRLRVACPRHRDDRDGIGRARRLGLDQGEGGHGADRSGGELRGLRDAAIDCRGGAQRRTSAAGPDGRRGARTDMTAKILLVDDSGLARRTTRQMLEAAGYVVVEAEDGMTALERYFLEKPDVVLLDLVMKGMMGLDVLDKLHRDGPEGPGDRGVGRHPGFLPRDGRRRRGPQLPEQAGRSRRAC